jgi:hypothetical protein
MNIYQMYTENDNKVGFWVIRNSWRNIIARITMIGNQTHGKLKGRSPYYNSPDVFCELYDLNTGKLVQNRFKYLEKDGKTTISCAGTYSYSMVDPNKVLQRFGWLPQ